ncbi:MAG: hypothetical protein LUD02_04315 [Tannerellaceae bacterium]|nr:hypothetical protein [Tannerellaceae bacterium]MCD8263471.1 hypothetical protein [Tannerellaceae bacterium]
MAITIKEIHVISTIEQASRPGIPEEQQWNELKKELLREVEWIIKRQNKILKER